MNGKILEMITFLGTTGFFCISYRIIFWYVADGKTQIFSEFSQFYGVCALILASFFTINESRHLIPAIWEFVIRPFWAFGALGALFGFYFGVRALSR